MPRGLVAVIIRENLQPSAMVGELARRFPKARLFQDAAGLSSETTAVTNFVETPVQNIDLPLDIHGTDFQRQVYREVCAIPFGETTTFAHIAARIGSPKADGPSVTPAREIHWNSPYHAIASYAATADGRAAASGEIGANARL